MSLSLTPFPLLSPFGDCFGGAENLRNISPNIFPLAPQTPPLPLPFSRQPTIHPRLKPFPLRINRGPPAVLIPCIDLHAAKPCNWSRPPAANLQWPTFLRNFTHFRATNGLHIID